MERLLGIEVTLATRHERKLFDSPRGAPNGDRALLAEMARLFVAESETRRCDVATPRRVAHPLEGAASDFGARDVVRALGRLRELVRSGERDRPQGGSGCSAPSRRSTRSRVASSGSSPA